jgi:2-hydroxychromene-2-carboxylate isomerase
MEFWFEFASTYSYPTALRIEQLAGAAGVPLRWRPLLLGPIFREQGWNDSPFNIYPAKGRYMWRDLERICAELQIPLRRPSQFPRNGLLTARLACWFQDEPWLPEFVRQVYRANFEHDRDISDRAVIAAILRDVGQPPDTLAMADAPEAKDKLRAQTEHARQRGIFGAPSFTIDQELFWGNDRLSAALAWARRYAAVRISR